MLGQRNEHDSFENEMESADELEYVHPQSLATKSWSPKLHCIVCTLLLITQTHLPVMKYEEHQKRRARNMLRSNSYSNELIVVAFFM